MNIYSDIQEMIKMTIELFLVDKSLTEVLSRH